MLQLISEQGVTLEKGKRPKLDHMSQTGVHNGVIAI